MDILNAKSTLIMHIHFFDSIFFSYFDGFLVNNLKMYYYNILHETCSPYKSIEIIQFNFSF